MGGSCGVLRTNNTEVGGGERRKMKPSVIINCVHLEIYLNEITEGGCRMFHEEFATKWVEFSSRNVQLIVINRSGSTITHQL